MDDQSKEVSEDTVKKEVFVINAFSSLFDTGAQVSCIKYDTVLELDLLHQISDSSTCIRTTNGQDVGVKGSIMVSFQIGSCSFTHRFIICKGITRPFILGEDFLSHHCFKLGWTDDNKRFAEYKGKVIAIASQAVMDDRIMVSRPVRIPARHFAIVPTNVQICLQVGLKLAPARNFKINSQICTQSQCSTIIPMVSGQKVFLT